MTSQELEPLCFKVLQYLYSADDEKAFHHSDTVCDIVGIAKDKELRRQILDELYHQRPRLIDSHSGGLLNAQIRLNTQGREHVLFNTPINMSDINATCEQIFKHLKEKGKIHWHSGTYSLFPRDANEATELMERQGVVYTKTTGTIPSRTTRLEPDIINATSYNEALRMIGEKNKPSPSTHIAEQYNFPNTHGTAIGKVSGSQNEIKTVQTTPKKERGWKDILREEVIKHGVRYLFTALIFFTTGLITGKGCSRADHQDKNIQSNSIKKDSVLSNQDASRH
jgi:hypothetical protein